MTWCARPRTGNHTGMTPPPESVPPFRPANAPVMVAKSPEDLLAIVPLILGFTPEESLCLLTFGAGRPFHARVDLPDDDEVETVVSLLRGPVQRHGVRAVTLVLYCADPERAVRVGRAVQNALEGDGVDTLLALRAHGQRWWPLALGRLPSGLEDHPAEGRAYDDESHPFRAQSVLDGQVTHRSRAELAATLDPDAERRGAADDALRSLPTLQPADWPAEAAWLRHTLAETVGIGGSARPLADDEAVRLLRAVGETDLRDQAWLAISRTDAARHIELWTCLLRRAPAGRPAAASASLLAFAAWLAGNGALAWCAVDRALDEEPGYRLAELLAQLLDHAVPPHTWDDGPPLTQGRDSL